VRHGKLVEQKQEENRMETKNTQELKKEEKNMQELNQEALEKVSGGDSIEEAAKKLAENIVKDFICPNSPDGSGKHNLVGCSNSEAGISDAESFLYVGKKCTFCGRIMKKLVDNSSAGYR
jgi:hypothetical protein